MLELRRAQSDAIVANLVVDSDGHQQEGVLYDASSDADFARGILEAIARRRIFKGQSAEIAALPSRAFRKIAGAADVSLEPAALKRDHSNTSIRYGDRLVLKLFRRLEEGINPDLEIGRFLTERTSFRHVPPLAGHMELRPAKRPPVTLAILQGWVANEGDAWSYTLDQLKRYFENAQARKIEELELPPRDKHILDLVDQDIPLLGQEIIGPYLPAAVLLGQRTAELHVALATDSNDSDFAPELLPFNIASRFIKACALWRAKRWRCCATGSTNCRRSRAATARRSWAWSTGSSAAFAPFWIEKSPPCACEFTATIIWAKCSIRAKTLLSLILKANLLGRSSNDA